MTSDKTPEHYDTNDRSRKGVRKLIIQKRVLSRDEYNAMIEELKNDRNWPYIWEDTPESNQERLSCDSDDDTDFLSTFDFDGFIR